MHRERDFVKDRHDSRQLATARVGGRRRHDREVAEDDDGVLDKDPFGVLVGGLDLGDFPSMVAKRVQVAKPLVQGTVGVDRHVVEVLQLTGGKLLTREDGGRPFCRRSLAEPLSERLGPVGGGIVLLHR
jgi:hypothetical protein